MNWFIKMTNNLWDLRKDGKLIFRGTENDCYKKLLHIQSSSWSHAMEHEGYTINPMMDDWKKYYKAPQA